MINQIPHDYCACNRKIDDCCSSVGDRNGPRPSRCAQALAPVASHRRASFDFYNRADVSDSIDHPSPSSHLPIRQLAPSLVNRIAAGEVIERPASVVKELVENAIDAGATQIVVAPEAGGRELIRIADDGCGAPPAELPLAFASHATRKLATDDDLFAIRTMG